MERSPIAPVDGDPSSTIRLPRGVRDLLPEAAAERRAITKSFIGEFERWGYRRIITPGFEYEAVLARGLGRAARERTVRFVEPSTGEVVALRPDITPQVARVVATRLAHEAGPLRLAYHGTVVRLGDDGPRELFQSGIELVGEGAPEGDVEVLALAGAALDAAGIRAWKIDLAEIAIARAALAGLDAEVTRAVGRKDREAVARHAHGLPARRRALVERLPSLYGGPEVLDAAGALLDGETERAALAALAEVVKQLVKRDARWADRLSIDLGEVRGFDYYTGLRFSGYAPGVGDAVLSGGRYDHLIERYASDGRSRPAAGFAVDIERASEALDRGAASLVTSAPVE